MSPWWQSLSRCLDQHPACAMVSVVAVEGSVPQSGGARMLIGRHDFSGTIGGGNLEWQALRVARAMLQSGRAQRTISSYSLGSRFGQCCGGRVTLMFEVFAASQRQWLEQLLQDIAAGAPCARLDVSDATAQRVAMTVPVSRFDGGTTAMLAQEGERSVVYESLLDRSTPLYVFGAGHVGQALVPQLAGLPFAVHWLDSRDDIFPEPSPGAIVLTKAADPVYEVNQAVSGAMFLILTHDHAQDFEILRTVLKRSDAAWIGLIGSASKWASFRHRLLARGHTPAQLAQVACPIGVAGISSKQPAVIAASVAAQLLQVRERLAQRASPDVRPHPRALSPV